MPIRKELRRQFYGRHWRTVVRPRILRRALGRFSRDGRYLGGAICMQCGKPDRKLIYTYSERIVPPAGEVHYRMAWLDTAEGAWRDQFGHALPQFKPKGLPRKIRNILAVAHLNHVPGDDDRDDNLAALCCWCHLHHDFAQHRETRLLHKDARRPLLAGFPAPRLGDFPDELAYCRAMQRWGLQDGDGPLRAVCIEDWFAEELLVLAERSEGQEVRRAEAS